MGRRLEYRRGRSLNGYVWRETHSLGAKGWLREGRSWSSSLEDNGPENHSDSISTMTCMEGANRLPTWISDVQQCTKFTNVDEFYAITLRPKSSPVMHDLSPP